MKEINGGIYEGERALFMINDAKIIDATFQNGESPLKECKNLICENDTFKYKYPLWYGENFEVRNCLFEDMSRAGIWYGKSLAFSNCHFNAPKLFRKCDGVKIISCDFSNAQETLWWNKNVYLKDVKAINGAYFAQGSENLEIENLELNGDYAFDHCINLKIRDSKLNTKDAFWNCNKVVLENCEVVGEYFGWNSSNVTLINCTVSSLQGFCYMDGITLINCKLIDTDRAFEYCSDINAEIKSHVISIKNPISGEIVVDSLGELILDDPNVDHCKTDVRVKNEI